MTQQCLRRGAELPVMVFEKGADLRGAGKRSASDHHDRDLRIDLWADQLNLHQPPGIASKGLDQREASEEDHPRE